MSTELIVNSEMAMSRHPDTVLTEASIVAKSVDRLVKQRADLVQVIGGRKHPRFELLQIVGQMFRVTARVRETRHLDLGGVEGWEAVGEAYHIPTGQVVATGEGMCLNDEKHWAVRPKYEFRNGKREYVGDEPVPTFQRRSMAQTRACSKALRLALGWVLGLAGYEAVAAEEMTGNEYDEHEGAPPPRSVPQPQRKSAAAQKPPAAPAEDNPFDAPQQPPEQPHPAPTHSSQGNGGKGGTISEAQAKRLYAIAMQKGLSASDLKAFLKSCGYERSEQIPRDRYDELVQILEAQ